MNNNIELVIIGIEEEYNVKLRNYLNESGYWTIQRALNDATELTQMYYPDVVVPIIFNVYIASKDIWGIEAMSISVFGENIIVVSPRVLKRPYEAILGTIIHEFVHLVAKTSTICDYGVEGNREIHEGLTELCSREIQREACRRELLRAVVCTKCYDDYVDYVVNKIYKARINIRTAAITYLNPKENEGFINDVFLI